MVTDIRYDDAETARRRESALKRMLSTPHKPHDESAKPRKGSTKSVRKKRATKSGLTDSAESDSFKHEGR